MNKEEIYNMIINEETSKNVLLNEIYAIRDKRKETQDFTIYVDGCISVDALNSIIKLKNMYKKEYNEHMEMKRQNEVLRNNERILKEKIEKLENKNKDLCENYCPKYKELEEKLKIQTQNYHSAYEDINWFCGKRTGKTVETALILRKEILKLPEGRTYGIRRCKKNIIRVIPEEVTLNSKIRDKIEELKNVGTVTTLLENGKDVNNKEYFMQDEIDILEELLEEEK